MVIDSEEFLRATKDAYKNKKYYPIPEISFFQRANDALIYHTRNLPIKPTNRLIHKICKRFNLHGKTIVDLGSGLGYYTFYFKAERNEVTGIELVDEFVQYSNERYGRYNAAFITGDVVKGLDCKADQSIDFIFCCNLPAHFDTAHFDTSAYIDQLINKVLQKLKKDEGKFYYLFYSTIHPQGRFSVTIEEVQNLMLKKNITNFCVNTVRLEFPMVELILQS